MEVFIYCVLDKLVGFLTPFIDRSDDAAKRGFSYALSSGMMQSFPEDYDLYKLGSLDTVTGVITPIPPEIVVSGRSVKGVSDAV